MKKNLVLAVVLSVFALPAFAQRYTVFPQFASGGGWSSEIFLANQGLSAVTGIVVSFYDDSGAPLTANSNLGSSAALAVNLNPGATQAVQITPGSTTSTGYVVIRYPSSVTPVTASEVYRYQPGDTVLAEVGVGQQDAGSNYSFPVEVNSSAGITTAFACANPTYDSTSALAQTVVATLINSDGTIRQTATLPLGTGQHISEYVTQLFPGLDNFTGSISVSSPVSVGVVAFRQDKEAFGAISTDFGPLLGPFAVSGTALAATGSNTNLSSAQQISSPALVTGYVGVAGGYYFFRFTGHQGDVASVICDTQGLNSSLDSVLYVTMSDGQTAIAENDQNGLYYENDSFLQVVLPVDGTYYIVLTDYYGGGGSSYPYRLHFRLISGSTS
jgi:hypothetical protein